MENFIRTGIVPDLSWCDKAIEWFEKNQDFQFPGVCSTGSINGVNEDTKKTTDISVRMVDLKCNMFKLGEEENFFVPIFTKLQQMFFKYTEEFYVVRNMDSMEIMPVFNMQKYIEGGHFKNQHFESSNRQTRHRVLVWLIYLNDVEEGGEKSFPFYNLKFKPKKGKILIWPAEFTHTHCGEMVLKDHHKYIMTGWIGLTPTCINEINFNKLPGGAILYGK